MLKLYRAYTEQEKIKVDDYIDFSYGIFDTGINGFGEVKIESLISTKVNYELQDLKYYKKYLQSLKTIDGYVQDFVLLNPIDFKTLEKKYKDKDKNFETYKLYGLNEEAILLFTDFVSLDYSNNESIQRIFGRHLENSMYLIMPNASFDMMVGPKESRKERENYEVLQSKNLGTRLSLTKMNRKI